jgi:hypothetical protein
VVYFCGTSIDCSREVDSHIGGVLGTLPPQAAAAEARGHHMAQPGAATSHSGPGSGAATGAGDAGAASAAGSTATGTGSSAAGSTARQYSTKRSTMPASTLQCIIMLILARRS